MRKERKPRLGFVGVGWIGRHRLQAVCEAGLADAVALADTASEALVAARAIAPSARCCARLDELLAQEDLDGVVLATPSALHAEQATAALARGLAVFCQKPLARTAAEAAAVVDAARRADRLLGVDLSYRHVDGVRRMRELVRGGDLGRVFAARLVFHNAYGPDKEWFYRSELAGGGCVMDLGTHLLDLVLWILERPVERVSARCYAGGQPLDRVAGIVEDYAVARLDLRGGTTAEVACSWRLHAGADCEIDLAFWGTEGGVRLRNVGGSFYDFVTERFRGTARETIAAPPEAWGGRALCAWAERLARDPGFEPEAMRAIEVAALVDRIYGREPALAAAPATASSERDARPAETGRAAEVLHG